MCSTLKWLQIICTAVVSVMMAGCATPALFPPPPPAAGRSQMDTSLVNPPILAGKFTLNEQFPTVQSLLENLRDTASGKMQQQGLKKGEFEPDDNRQWARISFSHLASEDWELGVQFMRNPESNSNVAQAWIRTAKLNNVPPSVEDVRQIATTLRKALESALPDQADSQPGQPSGSERLLAATRPAKSQARKKARRKPG